MILRLRKKYRSLAYDKNTRILIDGAPRSANTYFLVAFKQCTHSEVSVAHHVHSSIQFFVAHKNHVPCVFLIRKPEEAITSLVLKVRGMSIKLAFDWYQKLYQNLKPLSEDLIIYDFLDVVNQTQEVLIDLSSRVPDLELDATLYTNSATKRRVSSIFINQESKADVTGEPLLRADLPSHSKDIAKQEIQEIISERYSKRLQKVNSLYQLYYSRRVMLSGC